MTLNLTIPSHQHTDFSPRITVVGVGGGGTNAVNNMVAMGLDGVEFLVANTDAQSLVNSKADRRVQLGPHLTQGLGAGAKPEIGRAAAEEATEELARHLDGSHMVFVTAGMGGGTGTGAAPVIARMARERGILTVGVVTKPFDFEGPKRKKSADAGIEELQQFVDTLIVIPNQNLFRLANERTTFAEAFKMADNVLYMGVRGVTDLMVNPGLVNLDFADIRTVMAEMGKAMMGTGEAEGEERAVKAAEAAISNPLLEDTSMRGARGVLINITGGYDMTLFEVDEAANRIRKEVDEDANIIFGSSIDEDMNGRIRVSVVATGIDAREREAERPKLVAMGGGAAVQAVATQHAPQPQPQRGPGGFTPRVAVAAAPAPAAMRPAQAFVAPAQVAPAQPAPLEAPPVAEAPVVLSHQAEPALRAPAATRAPAQPAPAAGAFNGLFRRATGLMRRDVPDAAPTPQAAPAPRAEPAAPRPQARPAQHDEAGLDIPAFLRRQSN
ncbi:cell division protein FtsZ [Falsiroseomonas sp. CW058]|uniref:cell division protein FtsZ n=1 Tax=Falsiroseomonas sp. CW058 TaxID=3388664 RepID=UPI003D31D6F2